MSSISQYPDTFAIKSLPPQSQWPDMPMDSEFQSPEYMNAVESILDKQALKNPDKTCLIGCDGQHWTYGELLKKANQIAHVLRDDLQLQPGNRVLLRSANNPMLVACWFGVIKAGGIVVTTMPLLRCKELNTIIELAEISHALCDIRLKEELESCSKFQELRTSFFDGLEQSEQDLEFRMKPQDPSFKNFSAWSKDVALIGFTSGTTGKPKMTAHFHRDLVNICKAFPPHALQLTQKDVTTGSPPLGFTFGLGGLVLFPLFYGGATVLIEKPSPEALLEAIQKHKVSVCFTAPTAWRVLHSKIKDYDISSLRHCVSAGESLPKKVWQEWYDSTRLQIIDGIGATEMLHIFLSTRISDMKPGSTGKAIKGYQAKLVDKNGKEVPPNTPGRLAVKGITGCRYLNRPEKQKEYIQNGWNLTGDIFTQDEDGYFWYVSRSDDMIVSSGYNISAVVVEATLLAHPDIAECGVVGLPDDERGMIVCAFIVLKQPELASPAKAKEIQDWFKQNAAPYKYPRCIHFIESIPKTQTGKIQRYKLKSLIPHG